MTLQRGFVLGAFMAAWMLLLAGRLYHLQIIQYVDLVSRGERQQQRTIEIAPTRGTIYDRSMQPLAMSMAVDSVFAVSRPLTTTSQPASASLNAHARPSPRLEAQTMALRPTMPRSMRLTPVDDG